ncbi:hypothetical protein GX48_01089 [Paracoccidioides brasiliensis]|nr:hypothetical protein GX48_01089 [Paracoccidioides brasiliensis]
MDPLVLLAHPRSRIEGPFALEELGDRIASFSELNTLGDFSKLTTEYLFSLRLWGQRMESLAKAKNNQFNHGGWARRGSYLHRTSASRLPKYTPETGANLLQDTVVESCGLLLYSKAGLGLRRRVGPAVGYQRRNESFINPIPLRRGVGNYNHKHSCYTITTTNGDNNNHKPNSSRKI